MSRLDEIVTQISDQYGDASVSFEAGKLVLNKHAQQRKIIMVRSSGDLRFSAAPGRRQYGVPVGGAGSVTDQRFERFELIECTLRAEDEAALDAMLDRFVNAVFEVAGPNAFENVNPYEWHQGDSSAGGDWIKRNPAIKLYIRLRLKSRAQPRPYAVVAAAETDVEQAGAPADGVEITTP
jgi:hypothetical protein